ncbi:MAG: AMP-binding protein, partial [Hylemonella sp.]
MSEPRHHDFWPPGLPRHLTLPQTSLWFNVEVSATRYPDKPALIYYDTPIAYSEFRRACEQLAGWLHDVAGVRAGDRVLLYLQNSPQWVIAYYGIL